MYQFGSLYLAVVVSGMIASGVVVSCGTGDVMIPDETEDPQGARIFGSVTVDESLDDTGDNSGIELCVFDLSDQRDTLYHVTTDITGYFDGMARVPRKDIYVLEVRRHDRRIADTTLVLARQDTIHLEGTLPAFSGFAKISSHENDAMQILNRLERQYNRIVRVIAVQELPRDTIPGIMNNWSDIYWDLYQSYPETVAGEIAARESFFMLEEWNDQKLMRRLMEEGDHEYIRRLSARFGFLAKIRNEDLDRGIAWLDSLEKKAEAPETRKQIAINRIEALYDSSRTEEAGIRMGRFEEEFGRDSTLAVWLKSMRYDIDYLSRGQSLPSFNTEFFDHTGSSIFDRYGSDDSSMSLTLKDLGGRPVLIEVVRLSDRGYQQSYQQLRAIYMMFQSEGVQFLTFPVEQNSVLVKAFYDERGQNWPVARAGAFVESDLEEKWNVLESPVRFLIDSEGRIIRKFYGNNLNEIITELNQVLTKGDVS